MSRQQIFCADCQHLRIDRLAPVCASDVFDANPVTGDPCRCCEIERHDAKGICGPRGWRFEQRDTATYVTWVSRPGVMSKRSQEMLRWAAEDLADPVFRANPERMARERQLAVSRLAPHIEDVVQLAWRQLQADQLVAKGGAA